MRSRILPGALIGALVLSACSATVDVSGVPELLTVTTAEIEARLAAETEPVVLNVWASWCIPCRSEGPLLSRAAVEFDTRVQFIGINVRDTQDGARRFIAEFFPDAPIEHWFDGAGNVPVELGASRAVPLTFFYAPGGELLELHTGVLDERTLALQIDELLAGTS